MQRIKAYYSAGINADIKEPRYIDTVTGEVYDAEVGGDKSWTYPHFLTYIPGVYRTRSGNSELTAAQVPASLPTPGPIMDTASTQAAFDPSAGGRKNGKVRMELVFQGMPNALLELGKVMTWALEGKGYKEGDFLLVPDAVTKYRGAMLRHDLKEVMGQMHDDESGLVHAVHTAWNAMAKLEILLREQAQ